jgi:hypothetical protein
MWTLRQIRTFEKMAKVEELPPPHEIPQFEGEVPQQLIGFLYLLMRDLVPPGYIAGLMREAYMTRHIRSYSTEQLRDYAEEIARQLLFQETPTQ